MPPEQPAEGATLRSPPQGRRSTDLKLEPTPAPFMNPEDSDRGGAALALAGRPGTGLRPGLAAGSDPGAIEPGGKVAHGPARRTAGVR